MTDFLPSPEQASDEQSEQTGQPRSNQPARSISRFGRSADLSISSSDYLQADPTTSAPIPPRGIRKSLRKRLVALYFRTSTTAQTFSQDDPKVRR